VANIIFIFMLKHVLRPPLRTSLFAYQRRFFATTTVEHRPKNELIT
jgi:hypothetical protein